MQRFIPRKTKVKMQFLKNVTLGDLILAVIAIAGFIIFIQSNLPYNWYIAIAWLAVCVSFWIPVADGVRLYVSIGLLFRFLAFKKKYSKHMMRKHTPITELIPYDAIVEGRFISYQREYYAEVIEIEPVEFFMLSEYKQDLIINTIANALKRLQLTQQASIVKINKAMVFDKYMQAEERKYDSLMELHSEGEMTAEEVEVRSEIFEARLDYLRTINDADRIFKDAFYIVVYDKDKEQLDITIEGMLSSLRQSATPIVGEQLFDEELAIFLKANYGKDFDQRDVEVVPLSEQIKWATPDVVNFKMSKTRIDNKDYRSFVITDYPITVGNAWGYPIFSLDRTKVVVNIKPVPRAQAEKQIDRALIEMESQAQYSLKSSKQIEYQTHIDTLQELLTDIKNANEELYNVNIHIVCEEETKKEVRALLKQNGFKYNEMFGRQVDEFVSNNISKIDNVKDAVRGIHSASLAGMFPFISNALQDEGGFYLGYNSLPVFVDFYKRNSSRVNSNVMVVGKSGSGKSFATKTLLANLAADNARIFILDPEDEYAPLVKNLKGKLIDVGSSRSGILNPFHINATLQEDDDEYGQNSEEMTDEELQNLEDRKRKEGDAYALHLQFLEEFFRIIMDGMPSDAFELLNSLVADTYNKKGINMTTDITKLKPEDFPIFDDLYALVLQRIETEEDPYHKRNLQIIENYVKKFAKGGRNSKLWNGPTSIETAENFVTFSFLSLISNRNTITTNAQMLLVFKYLENEIIRNKDFNTLNDSNRKIVIAVDEAHTFINPKYPMALDFMAQMAKRIRKYGGMQIIITQNIKDFVGSQEIARQSTAVINASQYSMIFSLAPNDISDLVSLYRNAGEINQDEQDSIVTANIGECFFISGPLSRTIFKISPLKTVQEIFSNVRK